MDLAVAVDLPQQDAADQKAAMTKKMSLALVGIHTHDHSRPLSSTRSITSIDIRVEQAIHAKGVEYQKSSASTATKAIEDREITGRTDKQLLEIADR
ncbi:MAG: hypothetical protein R3F38_19145 [Gammaproteobacteria bacterium]